MADADSLIARMRMEAECVLLPSKDGQRQVPPHIFSGYRCSTIRPAGHWLETVGAAFYPVGRDVLHVGEMGLVQLEIYGVTWMVDLLRVGTHFLCFEGGRIVAVGNITAHLGPWTLASAD